MIPRKCLDECGVPYLCLIACPFNDRLERLALRYGSVEALDLDPDEPLGVEIKDKEKPKENIQESQRLSSS